jgi:hypothetical protein
MHFFTGHFVFQGHGMGGLGFNSWLGQKVFFFSKISRQVLETT